MLMLLKVRVPVSVNGSDSNPMLLKVEGRVLIVEAAGKNATRVSSQIQVTYEEVGVGQSWAKFLRSRSCDEAQCSITRIERSPLKENIF